MKTKINDAFNNCGLPQYVGVDDFSKNDIKTIKHQLQELTNYYKTSFLSGDSYNTLKNYINDYCVACRWYSLIIE